MARIQAKKDICLRQIHTYAAALSPCRRLPPELVSEIFLYVKERTWFSHGSPRPCLSLSQICSAWREVAINTAGLWTNIQIGYQQKRFPKKLLLLQMFFERTGEFPLSLGISTGVENLGSHEDLMMNILTPYFTRMQYLTMAAPYSCFAKIASLPPDSFPLLESFHFRSYYDPSRVTADPILEGPFPLAQRLRRFLYGGTLYNKTIHLPKQLTHLDLDDLTFEQSISALGYCPQLVELRMVFCVELQPEEIFPDEPVVLPNLEVLILVWETPAHYIFDHITIPAIDNLSISADECDSWSSTSFASLVTRSSCAPTKLELTSIEMEEEDFIEMLRLLPSLVYIDLECVRFVDDSVYTALIYKNGASLVPKLEELYFHTMDCNPTDTIILQVAKSRWWSLSDAAVINGPADMDRPSRLKRFAIWAHLRDDDRQSVHPRVAKEIDKLSDEGLSIHINYKD